jgi:hypothetical protein
MTLEKRLIEILEDSAKLNIRENVILLAKTKMNNDTKLSTIDAYEAAFIKPQYLTLNARYILP